MEIRDVPKLNQEKNETGCCPRFDPTGWDREAFHFDHKPFIQGFTRSFFYMPLNMSGVMAKLQKTAEAANAMAENWMLLSRDLSPWKCEHLYAVKAPLEGINNVSLSGTFVTRVFEGPYKDAKKWHDAMHAYAKEKGHTADKVFFYYTTCPKCAKHYGKNYVVGFAQLSGSAS